MRCPRCTQANQEHSVTVGMQTSTCMGITPGYWDADDKWHPPDDPNHRTTTYHCSTGHTWMETER